MTQVTGWKIKANLEHEKVSFRGLTEQTRIAIAQFIEDNPGIERAQVAEAAHRITGQRVIYYKDIRKDMDRILDERISVVPQSFGDREMPAHENPGVNRVVVYDSRRGGK